MVDVRVIEGDKLLICDSCLTYHPNEIPALAVEIESSEKHFNFNLCSRCSEQLARAILVEVDPAVLVQDF